MLTPMNLVLQRRKEGSDRPPLFVEVLVPGELRREIAQLLIPGGFKSSAGENRTGQFCMC
jgi:hypothetical protein